MRRRRDASGSVASASGAGDDRVPLLRHVAELLAELVQAKLGEVLAAQEHLGWQLQRPAPIRRLTGCCAVRERVGILRGGRPRAAGRPDLR